MTDPARILVVDDEKIARRTLKTILEYEGFQVTAVESGEEALIELEKGAFDCMILDLKMGGMSGMYVLEQTTERLPDLRVIVLTAFGSLETAIQAVRFHLSDYLLKPARPEEIIASVRKALADKPGILRESSASYFADKEAGDPFIFRTGAGELFFDFRKRRISWQQGQVSLTPTEARMLEVLIRQRNQVVQHTELVYQVQGYRVETEEAARILRPVMSRLRRKLEEVPGFGNWIQNVRGSGYLLELPNSVN